MSTIVLVMSTKETLSLFGSRTREKILSLFFLNETEMFYLRKIASQLKLSPGNVSRELKNLTSLEILDTQKSGNRVYYKINQQHQLYTELRQVFIKNNSLVARLKKVLGNYNNTHVAFIYGSFVSGTMTKDSDIDLFIVGDIDSVELSSKLRDLEQQYGRIINPMIMTTGEYRRKQDTHFIQSLNHEPKIYIIGERDEH